MNHCETLIYHIIYLICQSNYFLFYSLFFGIVIFLSIFFKKRLPGNFLKTWSTICLFLAMCCQVFYLFIYFFYYIKCNRVLLEPSAKLLGVQFLFYNLWFVGPAKYLEENRDNLSQGGGAKTRPLAWDTTRRIQCARYR